MERGRIQGLSKFFEYPLLSQERVKLRTSNLSGIFTGPIRNKSPLKNFQNTERGRMQGLSKFLGYPYYLGNGYSYTLQIWRVHLYGQCELNKSP